MSESPTLIIFGASGDLTERKLIPSLYRLFCKKRLPHGLKVVGVSRSPMSHDEFRQKLADAAQIHARREWSEQDWASFSERLFYVAGDATKSEEMGNLRAWLEENGHRGNYLFYLSVGPSLYEAIVNNLAGQGLNDQSENWRRLIIEKPFGRDLQSAQALNTVVRSHFAEEQIYRIDHYLGKETVQNILALRFANIMYEPIWNHNYIEHVQITVAESVSVQGRGDYYEKAGVLRDMFQNHLLQLLCLVAMEAPARYSADTLRNEKVKVLDAIEPPSHLEACQNIATGQYTGYLGEEGVDPKSHTPTYAAMRLEIDNWRWRGVPFYLRSGKAMSTRISEVIVQFRSPPHLMFPLPPGQTLESNRLALCIQPDEGIHVSFQSKVPDKEGMVLQPANLEFHYREAYESTPLPEAYERLLLDAINGDASLFMRDDEIERAWEIIDPFVSANESDETPQPEEYAVGSEGPACADEMLKRDGREWLSLCRYQ